LSVADGPGSPPGPNATHPPHSPRRTHGRRL